MPENEAEKQCNRFCEATVANYRQYAFPVDVHMLVLGVTGWCYCPLHDPRLLILWWTSIPKTLILAVMLCYR